MITPKIDLEQFKPVPHPLKAIFKKHGIPHVVLGNYLGKNPTYVSQLLAGVYKIPQQLEDKLSILAEQLDSEEAA